LNKQGSATTYQKEWGGMAPPKNKKALLKSEGLKYYGWIS